MTTILTKEQQKRIFDLLNGKKTLSKNNIIINFDKVNFKQLRDSLQNKGVF